MKFNLWLEGYEATGQSGSAQFLGAVEAPAFIDACRKFAVLPTTKGYGRYEERPWPSFWACRVYDNEADARRRFG